METRAKSRRQEHLAANPDPRGLTRQNGPSTAQSSQSQPSQQQPKAQGLGALPFARRGARATERAASIASIQTVPYRPDEETVVGEGEFIAGIHVDVDDGFAPSSHPKDAEPDSEDRITKFRIMELSLDDLASSAAALMRFLKDGDFDDAVYRGRLKIKKKALDSVRESFEEEAEAPFIDWTQTQDMWKSQGEADMAATVIVLTNIVTALYEVTALQTGTVLDSFAFLDRLNSFSHLIADPDDMFRYPHFPELLLDIRTWYLIESLERLSEKPNILKHIASVFCEPVEEGNIYELLASGPYKELGAASSERVEQLVSSRIQEIVPIMQRDKQTHGVHELKETFPLETLWDQIGTWLVAMYGVLRKEDNSQSQTQGRPESARHSAVGDDFEDSQTTVSESQPIARVAGNEPSLFIGKASINYVNSKARSNYSEPPPSNQQQIMPPPGAPRDYREHTNSDLLASPLPPSTYRDASAQPKAPEVKRKRILVPDSLPEDDDEDEEDHFETDTRKVAKGKRRTVESSMQPPKRARLEVVPQSSLPRTSLPQSSAPSPTRPSHIPSTSQPTRADFDALRQAKERISQQARATLSPFVRQRHGWSPDDMVLLLELIRDRHAAWATIERHDNHKFEHPRNQQAYRDKARNMKVDYLRADAVLPPCFDLVALGRKEVDALISLGKNPYRKEDDVDQNGRAINTEYVRE
ncbi:hypothetical protein B0T10DRAFT_66049 [Thelonectria olida]|uniref:Myb-like domain-containing protein n=1 Tax=Thelonectria olida TaxID=1576542 RepID=A0A9P9AP54_9HYPO|nr:hypothetical protein B0T10DRAFT_66049 [Thelonectria olida]